MTAQKKKAGKKKATKDTRGGRGVGAGGWPGTGTGPSKDARINRVVAMLSNDELKTLTAYAKGNKLPLATQVYQILRRAIRSY